MYRILEKRVVGPNVTLMKIDAPYVARKAEAGQFIILRVNEGGERIPLTVADYDRENGTVTIIFQEVGKTTKMLGGLNEGESILDFTGPLGKPTHYQEGIKKAAVIGGGLGTAIAYPQVKKLRSLGVEVDAIIGFRNSSLIFLKDEIRAAGASLHIATEDGSEGLKGFVTEVLKKLIDQGAKYDIAIAIGPLVMMKAVSEMTKKLGIDTIVSMNPIMVDGTGMCGGCRVTVGGQVKFACVDGPDFDGHQVDFDEAIRRQGIYRTEEKLSTEKHECKLGGLGNA
ncbi:MAG: sulfide/dihydroorotate dehydrogenase-like FAD/NAD-binding protein [Eubacteriales bacterium]|nr:sulfide/dihydroorotate dehydrogenase-like FAD/NAD-binding protein [Eubacteriales bacterium]